MTIETSKKTAREQLSDLLTQLGSLSMQKRKLEQDWEKSKAIMGEEVPKPAALKMVSRQMFDLHSQCQGIVARHPELKGLYQSRKPKETQGMVHTTQAALSSADRQKRKKAISSDFKAWCGRQKPQIKPSLENWDDPTMQERFRLGLIAEEVARVAAEERRKQEAEQARIKAEEEAAAKKVEREAKKLAAAAEGKDEPEEETERDFTAELADILDEFSDFKEFYLEIMVKAPAKGKKQVAPTAKAMVDAFDDHQTRALYELWQADQPELPEQPITKEELEAARRAVARVAAA